MFVSTGLFVSSIILQACLGVPKCATPPVVVSTQIADAVAKDVASISSAGIEQPYLSFVR